MGKVGFRFDTDIVFAGLLHRLYRLSVLDWEMNRGGRKVSDPAVRAPGRREVPQST